MAAGTRPALARLYTGATQWRGTCAAFRVSLHAGGWRRRLRRRRQQPAQGRTSGCSRHARPHPRGRAMSGKQTRAGMVALAGRPNVGKSTLVNALVGEKVSIVTPKPQTTRHRIVGVLTADAVQIALVDTPGLHAGRSSALNRVMNETAVASLAGIDLVLLVVEAGQWRADDKRALALAARSGTPVALVINKVDRVDDKQALLPFIERLAAAHEFAFVVPLSARKQDNLAALQQEMAQCMPPGPYLFPEDEYTDRNLRFIAAEIVREKLMLHL